MASACSDLSNSGNANKLIDLVLNKIYRAKIDPLPIKLDKKNFKILNGQVQGLSGLHRHGNCTFYGNVLETNLILQLEARALSTNFHYEKQIGFSRFAGEQ